MMKAVKILILAAILAVLLQPVVSTVRCDPAAGQAVNSSWSSIGAAFTQMQDTYKAVGSVPQVDVTLLNEAIANATAAQNLVNSNPSQAQQLAQQATATAGIVNQSLVTAKTQGSFLQQLNGTVLNLIAIVLIVLAILIYRFGPDALRGVWFRQRKNYGVRVNVDVNEPSERKEGKAGDKGRGEDAEEDEDRTLFTIDNICKIVAVILVVIAVTAIVYPYLANKPGEQFSELGVLGPTQNLSGYPTEVVAGSTVNLYTYVGNYLDAPAWYSVQIKIGDNSTAVNPANLPAALTIDTVLLPGENSTLPANVLIPSVGDNQRIIFELWEFNATTGSFSYTGLWDQIWLNVTAEPVG